MSEVENTKNAGTSSLGTSGKTGTSPLRATSISPEERLEQRRKALEKANAVRSEKASLKRREKEIQKKVYEKYKDDLDRTERTVFAPKPEVDNELQASPGQIIDAPESSTPVKHIKIEKKRNKKVILEWSDSDSDVDDEAIQRAFKTGYKKKPVLALAPESKQISKEEYEKTLLQARYGQTVKRVMEDNIEKQKQVINYYHGWT